MNEEVCRRALKTAGVSITENEKIECSEEDSPGLSYSSLLQRFKISVVDGSAEKRSTVYVILKSNPDVEHPPDSLFDKMFTCEIKVYKNILPFFKELFDKTGNEVVWPQLYGVTDNGQIIMEDLKPDFRNNFAEGALSLDEALAAINSLAKFHAASLAGKQTGNIDSGTLEPYFYCRRDESINNFFKDGLRILVKTMRQSSDESWLVLTDKLENLGNNIGEVLIKLHFETNDKFKVINHGDYWRANLMFNYDKNNKPVSFRFVDFQLSHYGSLAWDLNYFFFASPNLNLLHVHYDQLLLSYHNTMSTFLDVCGSDASRLSLIEIRQELERLFLYGFLKSSTDLPYQLCSIESGIDAENLFKNNEETDMLKMNLYSAEKYKKILRTHIDFMRKMKII